MQTQTMYLVIVPLLHDILSTKGKLNAFWVADGNTQQHFCWRNKNWVELLKYSCLNAHLRSLLTSRLCLFDTVRKCYRFSISKYNDWSAKKPPKSTIFQSCKKIEDIKFLRRRFLLLSSSHDDTIQGPQITNGRNSNEMLILPTDIM